MIVMYKEVFIYNWKRRTVMQFVSRLQSLCTSISVRQQTVSPPASVCSLFYVDCIGILLTDLKRVRESQRLTILLTPIGRRSVESSCTAVLGSQSSTQRLRSGYVASSPTRCFKWSWDAWALAVMSMYGTYADITLLDTIEEEDETSDNVDSGTVRTTLGWTSLFPWN